MLGRSLKNLLLPHPYHLQVESIQLMKETLEKCLPPLLASLTAEPEGSTLPWKEPKEKPCLVWDPGDYRHHHSDER